MSNVFKIIGLHLLLGLISSTQTMEQREHKRPVSKKWETSQAKRQKITGEYSFVTVATIDDGQRITIPKSIAFLSPTIKQLMEQSASGSTISLNITGATLKALCKFSPKHLNTQKAMNKKYMKCWPIRYISGH